MAVVLKTGDAGMFVSLNQNHVNAARSKFILTLGGMKYGAAVMSLALVLVWRNRLAKRLIVSLLGARAETAAVAKSCISASHVKESAMTIEKMCLEMTDLTYPVLQ